MRKQATKFTCSISVFHVNVLNVANTMSLPISIGAPYNRWDNLKQSALKGEET